MTSSASRIENGRLTLSDLQTVRFQESKGFGRGYDEAEVDAFVARCASEWQRLTKRVDELEAQASTLSTKGPTDGYIAHAIGDDSVRRPANRRHDREER